jgi:hypothetical protein
VEPVLGFLFAGLVGSIVYLLSAEKGRARARGWREAARAASLTDVEETETLGVPRQLTGLASGLRVRLEGYRRGKYERGTRVTIGPLGHGPYGFALRREGLGTAFEKAVGETEIEIGDRHFDDEFYVQGAAPLARALLDAETRRRLGMLFRGELGVETRRVRVALAGDRLQVELRERSFANNGENLRVILPKVLAVARRLVAPADVPARLTSNLGEEPDPRVRLACLQTLVREFPDSSATRAALLAARSDASDEVRLRAAMALGAEGRPTLLSLASDETTLDACAGRAVGALGEHLEPSRAAEILDRARQSRRVATAAACLEALGRRGGGDFVARLSTVLHEETADLAAIAAAALGETGLEAAEAPLVAALACVSTPVRIAAARALGRVGGVSAVPPLREAGEQARDRDLGRAVRQSIAEIQSRLKGAAPGQLSLSEGLAGDGRLSLADDDATGRVSLADDEEAAPVAAPRPRGRERA